ncbi:putative nuclease HARBI1 [Cucumis melo var. makuwa]|uniref:Nuclease HARBI1 n=1 Tax=Cucumis melo var. makuwa TaxID=1194695 RepID=A0A5A7VCX2_CUCMM|nr:putative nuclease HARBI1 [Cucumis melo var. makuwa]
MMLQYGYFILLETLRKAFMSSTLRISIRIKQHLSINDRSFNNAVQLFISVLNREGFLAPYRGQRYHLQEWRGAENAPSTSKEFFNMKHLSARNVIERAFNVLKGRWAILRGKSYYLVEVQCRTIVACCLLHNLINREMTTFDIVDDIDEVDSTHAISAADDIHYIEMSNE